MLKVSAMENKGRSCTDGDSSGLIALKLPGFTMTMQRGAEALLA